MDAPDWRHCTPHYWYAGQQAVLFPMDTWSVDHSARRHDKSPRRHDKSPRSITAHYAHQAPAFRPYNFRRYETAVVPLESRDMLASAKSQFEDSETLRCPTTSTPTRCLRLQLGRDFLVGSNAETTATVNRLCRLGSTWPIRHRPAGMVPLCFSY